MNNRKSDYYKVLNLNRDCNPQEIKKNYRALALKWHPDKQADKTEAHSKFNEIREAYSVLIDPKQRKMYDLYGHQGVQDNDGISGQSGMYFAKGFQGTEKSAFDVLWDILQEKEDDSFDQNNDSYQMPDDFKTDFFGLFESRATSEVEDNHFINNYQPTFTQTEFCAPPEEYTALFRRKNSLDLHNTNSNFSFQYSSTTNTNRTRSNSGVFMAFSCTQSPNESPRNLKQSSSANTQNSNVPFIQKKPSIIVIDEDDEAGNLSSDHSQQPVNPWIAQLNEFQVILDRFHNNLEENLNIMNNVSPNSKKIHKREKFGASAHLAKNANVDRFGSKSISIFS